MKITDEGIKSIIKSHEADAIGYQGDVHKKRKYLLDRYNQEPYGDELEGQSQVVASDVADTVESMLPAFMRLFTQTRHTAVFTSDQPEYDEEAQQKTELANWVFNRDNDGTLILHNMFKDAILQYTGIVKVYWEEKEESTIEKYKGLSDLELAKLKQDKELKLKVSEAEFQGFFDVEATRVTEKGRVQVDNIPPDEFMIGRTDRSFDDPVFIGQRTPKTRSDLVAMGFDKDIVDALPIDPSFTDLKRDHDSGTENNPSDHRPNDMIMLGEYYTHIDADGDGVTELWQVFYAGEQILDKEQVPFHPYCVITPIPIPHRAIGNCPAEQAADIQKRKTALTRQMLNNVYSTNYPRFLANERVDMDALLTPRAGGVIPIDGSGPIGDAVVPLFIQPVIEPLLAAIEYTNGEKELRTGVTRYSQGLDADSLNKTATGFLGIRDMSQMRVEMIARIFADTGVREIFRKIVALLTRYQDEALQIRVSGAPLEVDPTAWRNNLDCSVGVGIGAGDRAEKIANLNGILQHQKELKLSGSLLVDEKTIYNTFNKLIDEIGLKETGLYFNNPEIPEDVLLAQNEQLMGAMEQMQAAMQNPLAEQERIKQQGTLIREQLKTESEMRQLMMELDQKQEQFNKELVTKLTELELKFGQNIPGSAV